MIENRYFDMMVNMKTQIIQIALLIMLTGCGAEAEARHTIITPQAAQEMMMQYGDIIILDVRSPEEFQSGHIPGAILIPHDRIRSEIVYLIPDFDQIVLVYCRTGNRSNIAALTLVELGYRAVYDFGGIVDWQGEVSR